MEPERVEPRMTLRGCAGAASPRLYCNVVKAPNGPDGRIMDVWLRGHRRSFSE